MIDLTEELIKQNTPASSNTVDDETSETAAQSGSTSLIKWSSGDKCMAAWSHDGQYVFYYYISLLL